MHGQGGRGGVAWLRLRRGRGGRRLRPHAGGGGRVGGPWRHRWRGCRGRQRRRPCTGFRGGAAAGGGGAQH
jgi:hypothetical protein